VQPWYIVYYNVAYIHSGERFETEVKVMPAWNASTCVRGGKGHVGMVRVAGSEKDWRLVEGMGKGKA
jgi:hypothetical protein